MDDVCRQLEGLAFDFDWEYHKKDCPYFLYHAENGSKCLPDNFPIQFNPMQPVISLCNCEVRKHTRKIMKLSTQLRDALELFGIEPRATFEKYYGEEND